jgi:hypothetical protein
MTEANTSESINIYTYHGRNLWVSYGIAIGLTVLVDLLGLLACLKDKTTYERSLAFILTAAGRGDVAELFSDHLRGTPNMHTLIGGNRIVFHHDEELGLVMGRAT